MAQTPGITQVIHEYMSVHWKSSAESIRTYVRTWVEQCKGAGVPSIGEEATYEPHHQQPPASGWTKMETNRLNLHSPHPVSYVQLCINFVQIHSISFGLDHAVRTYVCATQVVQGCLMVYNARRAMQHACMHRTKAERTDLSLIFRLRKRMTTNEKIICIRSWITFNLVHVGTYSTYVRTRHGHLHLH